MKGFFPQGSFLMALACMMFLAQVLQCQGDDSTDKPIIDTKDYFQLPADMIDHFPLLHFTQHNEQAKAFAHVVKNSNSWTTLRDPTTIQIPIVNTSIDFLYENPDTGTITKVRNVYSTVADTVYLEHLESVKHVTCDQSSTLTIVFNSSLSQTPSTRGLKFGLKRAHYTTFTKVAGGQSFFCQSSCSMGDVISRSVVKVISHSEDPTTGYLSSITIQTSAAPSETLYNAVADIFMNGTIALIPKSSMRVNQNSGRLNWHGYAKKVHLSREESRKVKLRSCNSDKSLCSGGVGTGWGIGFKYVKGVSPVPS
jgi:hypothetical protein